MKPTLKLCSSHSVTGISKTPDLVTSLEPVPLFGRARGTTRESLIEGAKQKHTQREGLYDLRIRCRGVSQAGLSTLRGPQKHQYFDEKSVKVSTLKNKKAFQSKPTIRRCMGDKENKFEQMWGQGWSGVGGGYPCEQLQRVPMWMGRAGARAEVLQWTNVNRSESWSQLETLSSRKLHVGRLNMVTHVVVDIEGDGCDGLVEHVGLVVSVKRSLRGGDPGEESRIQGDDL